MGLYSYFFDEVMIYYLTMISAYLFGLWLLIGTSCFLEEGYMLTTYLSGYFGFVYLL